MNRSSKQIIKIIVFVVAVVVVSFLIIKLPAMLRKTKITRSGKETFAPLFSVKSINYPGRIISLKKLRGKIVLVNFWATWCPPCRHEIPRLEKFYKAHKKDGFTIIGLSVNDQGSGYVEKFIKTFKGGIITYPVGMANYGVEKAYGNVYEIPQSFLINRQGIVVVHFTGELPPGFLSYEFTKADKLI